jgi:hypothetical protein
LAWEANTEYDLNHYHIHRYISQDAPPPEQYWPLIGETNQCQFDDMTFYPRPGGPETAYYYVRAVDDAERPSSPSNTVGSHGYIIENADGSLTCINIANNPIVMKLSPNPFNSSLAIRFELQDASPYKLVIYDINGREVWKLASRNS